MNSDEKAYNDVKRHVRKLRHFYKHLATYAVVITFLHIINLLTSSYYWAIWPALGWGIAIVLHSIRTSDYVSMFGKEWEEKKIQQILAKRSEQTSPALK